VSAPRGPRATLGKYARLDHKQLISCIPLILPDDVMLLFELMLVMAASACINVGKALQKQGTRTLPRLVLDRKVRSKAFTFHPLAFFNRPVSNFPMYRPHEPAGAAPDDRALRRVRAPASHPAAPTSHTPHPNSFVWLSSCRVHD
jgi:hypothetical protein